MIQRFTEYYSGSTWVRSNVNGWNAWKRIDATDAIRTSDFRVIAISVSGGSSYQAIVDNWNLLPEAIPFAALTFASGPPYTGVAFGNKTGVYGHFIYFDYGSAQIYSVQYHEGYATVSTVG